MDFWLFVLNTAQTVLGGLITDLINGKLKEAGKEEIKAEIKKEVAAKLQEQSLPGHQDLKLLVREVMQEIEILSLRDPDLIVSDNFIQLAKPVKRPILPFQDKDINKQLQERLQRLNDIIAKRREEKGLSAQHQEEEISKSIPTKEVSSQKHFTVLKAVKEPLEENQNIGKEEEENTKSTPNKEASSQNHSTVLKPVSEPLEDNQIIRQEEEENTKSTPNEKTSFQKHTLLKPVGEESKEVVETPLTQRIREMDERIRRRRAGEYLDDDK